MLAKILLLTALLFIAVLSLFRFRRHILNGTVAFSRQVAFCALVFGILLMYFPYMIDYIFLGEYTVFHLNRISSWSGTFLQFLSVPSLLYRAGFSLMTAYKLFVLLTIITTAAVTFFSVSRCCGDYHALLISLCYLLSPYYLHCLYVQGDVGVFTAYIFLPLISSSLWLLFTEDPSSARYSSHKWYLIWGLAGLWLSHFPAAASVTILIAICYLIARSKACAGFIARLQHIYSSSPHNTFLTFLLCVTIISAVAVIYQSNTLLFEAVPYHIDSAEELVPHTECFHLPTAEITALISLIILCIQPGKETKHP